MEKRGLVFVLFTAIVSGFSIFINKFGVKGINPFIFTWGKNVIVVLLLLSAALYLKEHKKLAKLTKRQWAKLAAIGFVGGSVPFLLFFKGLSMTAPATAAFIHKTMFVFVGLMAFMFLKEKLSKGIFAAGALLLIGNFLLLKLTNLSFDKGALLVLIATLFWAVETTISKHTLKEMPSRTVALGRMGFGALFILVFLVFTGNAGSLKTITPMQIGWIVLTSVLLFLYVLTWYAGLKLVKATTATCILLLGSVITTTLSFITGAPVTLMQAVGMLFIVGGAITAVNSVFIIEKSKKLIYYLSSQLHSRNE